jgi:putative ABC transport system permease protein
MNNMSYKELFLESVLSLKKNAMRSGLTMLGVIIGISAVILIVSIGQGSVKFISNELSIFGTDFFGVLSGSGPISTFAGGQRNLTIDDADAIRSDKSITNIKSVVPIAIASIPVTANGVDKQILIRGVTHEAVDVVKPTILAGTFITEEQYLTSSRVAVIGIDTSIDFFGANTDPVGEIIRIDKKPFRIIGLVQSTNTLIGGSLNNTIFIPINILLDQILGQKSNLQQIGIRVNNPDFINQTIDDVSVLIRERHNIKEGEEDDFNIQNFGDAIATVQTIINLLTLIVAAISGISLVVGGVGVMNIMLVSVTERTKEIGLLKALGAKQRDILTQFLMEAVVITLSGGIIGIILGLAGTSLVTSFTPIPFVVSVPAIIIAVGVSAGVGIIFGLYPARRAARLSPIDALRYE